MVKLHKRLLQQKWQNCNYLMSSSSGEQSISSWARILLAHGPSFLASLALFFLMAMTFADVVLRSVFNDPIESATELTRLLMAIIVFSSLPIVSWNGKHIVIDLLDHYFSKAMSRVRNIFVDGICGIILIWPSYRVWELAERAKSYGDTTEYLEIPQFYVAYFIAIATMITSGTLIVRSAFWIFSPSKLEEQTLHA